MKMIENHTLACPYCFSDGPSAYGIDGFYLNFISILFECHLCKATSALQIEGGERTTIEWKIMKPGTKAFAYGRR